MKMLQVLIKNCHEFDIKKSQIIIITKPTSLAIKMLQVLIKNCHEFDIKKSQIIIITKPQV